MTFVLCIPCVFHDGCAAGRLMVNIRLVCLFLTQEEVMTMERILLQTIKFDLQVEHPYSFLLNFAKQIKGRG